jgi:hypothetical protein
MVLAMIVANWRPSAMAWTSEMSPRFRARISAVLFLLTLLGGVVAQEFISNRLVVHGDAAATAANILANKGMYQLGFTVYVIEMACNIAMVILFYTLLKPAGRTVSLIAAALGLAACVIKTFARVFYIVPLFVLGGAHYLSVFSTEQLQALALLCLSVNGQGAGMALAFFGFYNILIGYLIIKSTFLPRVLGVLFAISGVGWLTFLSPTLGSGLFDYIAVFALLGSAATLFWLFVFGVNEQRWREQAGETGPSIFPKTRAPGQSDTVI